MPLGDLLRALPVVIPLGLIPGLALATLIGSQLSWPERLAAAPGLSVALVGVTGLLLRVVHLPFAPATVLPVLLVVVALSAARCVRDRTRPSADLDVGWAGTVVAVAAGTVLVAVGIGAMSGYVLPPGTDASVHATVAAGIVADHNVLPVIPTPADGSGYVRPQAAFEATDALASELGAGSPAGVMLPLALVSLLMLPLGVALLAQRAFQDRRISAVAAMLSLGVIFPAWPLGFGDYPFLVDSTLVVPLILAVARCLEGRRVVSSAVMAGALVLGIWVIHGLEIPTALAIGGALWLAILLTRRRAALGAALAVTGAVVVAAVAGYLLTRAPAIPAGQSAGVAYNETSAYLAQQKGTGLSALDPFINLDVSVITALLLGAGAAVMIVRRRGLWLFGALVIPVLCVLDIAGPELLHPIWVRVYPWTDLERVYGLEFFVVPIIAGLGAVAVIDLVAHRLAGVRTGGGPHPGVAWSATALALVASVGLAVGAVRTSAMLSSETAESVQVSAGDLAVIQDLAGHLPPGALILNNGAKDAGQWITALTPDLAVEPNPYTQVYPDDWRMVALGNACSDPAAAESALQGVAAVYVGSDPASASVEPWSAACLASLPPLHLVAGSTSGPAGFLVG